MTTIPTKGRILRRLRQQRLHFCCHAPIRSDMYLYDFVDKFIIASLIGNCQSRATADMLH
jgi:hypothetical protein